MIILRKASSMIELVIAIVVMGIAVMALPLMLERSQENNAFAIQQETILAARTQIGDILTYPWDENSIRNNVVGVLNTNSPEDELDRNTTIRRVGHVLADKRRKFFNADINSSNPLGQEGTDIDDIDDFTNVIQFDATGGLDYRFDFNMTTTALYVNDSANYSAQDMATFTLDTNASLNTTNIKMIALTLNGTNLDTFTLRAYSTNIGGSQLLRRDW